QLIQAKIENLVRLVLTEGVTPIRQARGIANQNADLLDLLFGELEREQYDSRLFAIGGSANDPNEFVQICERDEIPFEGLGPFLRLAQLEACPPQNNFAPMFDISRVCFLKRE